MTIPIAQPEISAEAKQRVEKVLDSGYLADGPEVRAFEEEFAAYIDAEHAVATSNGTTALHAALVALGIGEDDRVLTTPFSFIATANAIRFVGAEAVFADIDPRTFNLDPAAVRDVVATENVDAILAVHLYGLPADLESLGAIADDHGIPLIEDAAQAHGACIDGTPVGAIGDVGCFSFYPTKNMTTGEGGMFVTDEESVADRVRRFIDHGRTSGYEHAELGHNFRMTSIAAAIGRSQLQRLDDLTSARRENAARLTAGLEDVVEVPDEPDGYTHVYHQYTIRTDDRDRLRSTLDAQGIGTGVYYPCCIHEQPAYSDVTADLPVAERAAREVLSLPVHPGLSESDLDHIIQGVSQHELELTAS